MYTYDVILTCTSCITWQQAIVFARSIRLNSYIFVIKSTAMLCFGTSKQSIYIPKKKQLLRTIPDKKYCRKSLQRALEILLCIKGGIHTTIMHLHWLSKLGEKICR